MPFAIGGGGRIRTNTPAENAYNSLDSANRDIALRQLRLSTGKRINNAADDVAGYITSRALIARNGALQAALKTVGDASNVSYIIMDGLDNIYSLLNNIKDATAAASNGAQGEAEKIALAKAAYRMAEQVQTVVESTVFGGRQLISGDYSADFVVGTNATHNLLTLTLDMRRENTVEFNTENYFDLNLLNDDATENTNFAGISGLNLTDLSRIAEGSLGIFDREDNDGDGVPDIQATLQSLSDAIDNINKVASYVGGVVNRLQSQEDLLKGQITNYNAAISRIEDADVAQEQLQLVKSQFLQQASLTSLAQANMNPQAFLQLISG